MVSLVQRYVSTTLKISMAFLLRENQRHERDEQTDGPGATLNGRSLEREGCIKMHTNL